MQRALVDQIFKEKTTNNSISLDLSNALNIISKTVFGEINRFIFELLQNADDSADKNNPLHVKFRLLDNYLIFSHTGKHFTPDDVKGISSVGSRASQKDRDTKKTGYKGIGFKSIFGSSEYAYIQSGGFTFRFDKNYEGFLNPDEYPWQVIPIWTEYPPKEVDNWIISSEVSTVIGIEDHEIILKEISEVLNDCQIILFLRNVMTITFYQDSQQVFKISKEFKDDLLSLYKNGNRESSWLLRPVNLEVSESLSQQLAKLSDTECPQKLKDAKTTKLTFAAKVEDGKFKGVNQSVIYTYLPTKAQKGFPFLINGDFLTNAERTALMPNVWNQYLFKEIAIKQLEWLKDLQNTKYKYQVLHLLKEKSLFTDSLIDKAYNEGLDFAATNVYFLPVQNESDERSSISKSIVDLDHLTKLFQPSTVLNFMENTQSMFVLDRELEKQDVLLRLGAQSFSFKDTFAMIASGRASNINSAINFMVFFYNNTVNGDKETWLSELQKVAFIMDENGIYRNVAEVFLKPKQPVDYGQFGVVNYIHDSILNHFRNVLDPFRKWLDKLGVKEPNNIEILRKTIVPLIEGNLIDENNYSIITDFIFATHKSKFLTENDYEKLRRLPVRTINGFKIPSQAYLHDEYNPEQKLSKILTNGNFLVTNYVEFEEDRIEWKAFFKRIGVRDKLSIDMLETVTERTEFVKVQPEAEEYFNWLDVNQAYPTLYYPWRLSGQHSISNFTKVEFRSHLKDPKFAKLFWTGILDNWDDFINRCGSTKYHYRGGHIVVPSFMHYYVANFPSVPANDGNSHKSTSLFSPVLRPTIGEYLPMADFPASITRDQISFFQFKTILSLVECLEILNKISHHELSADRKKQIFSVYNYMIGNALRGQDEIKEWRKNARLLNMNNSFQPIEKLYIFNINGNLSPTNQERFLTLSSGKSLDEINALSELLLVPIISINMLTFEKKGEVIDQEIKSAIFRILVYLAIIHAHNTGDNVKGIANQLREKIEARNFYKAEQLKLTYMSDEGEAIIDNEIEVWNTLEPAIYYTGNWKLPLTLYSLSSILCDVLQLKNMEREFALMILLSDDEIKKWLIKNNYDIEPIKEFGLFSLQNNNNEGIKAAEVSPDEESVQEQSLKIDFFEVKIKVKDIDFSNVTPIERLNNEKVFSNSNEYKQIEDEGIRINIGRWSEEYVFEYFKSKPTVFRDIKWMNEEKESHLPYDFEVVDNGVHKLIEVKGTPSLKKTVAHISKNEWQVLTEKGEDYSIFRVYGAGTEKSYMERIDNPKNIIDQGSIDFKVELLI